MINYQSKLRGTLSSYSAHERLSHVSLPTIFFPNALHIPLVLLTLLSCFYTVSSCNAYNIIFPKSIHHQLQIHSDSALFSIYPNCHSLLSTWETPRVGSKQHTYVRKEQLLLSETCFIRHRPSHAGWLLIIITVLSTIQDSQERVGEGKENLVITGTLCVDDEPQIMLNSNLRSHRTRRESHWPLDSHLVGKLLGQSHSSTLHLVLTARLIYSRFLYRYVMFSSLKISYL